MPSGTKIGIGVGVGFGVAIIILLSVVLALLLRKRKNRQQPPPPPTSMRAEPNHSFPHNRPPQMYRQEMPGIPPPALTDKSKGAAWGRVEME